MNDLYVTQLTKVKVILKADELCADYEKIIKKKICDSYGNKCYLGGFIQQSSIDVIHIDNGIRMGSHLHGYMTFMVEFSALYCIPRKGLVVDCIVESSNRFAVMANIYPMTIMIPRELQQYNNPELLKDLNPGDPISVEIFDYTIEQQKLMVLGMVRKRGSVVPHILNVPDGLASDKLPINLPVVQIAEKPQLLTHLGYNDTLSVLRYQIPADVKNNDFIKWNDTDVSKCIINYDTSSIYSPDSIYPILSRKYLEMWEILTDMKIFDKYHDKPIHITNLQESSCGFVQSIIDFRNRQHKRLWTDDQYHMITRKYGMDSYYYDWDNYDDSIEYFKALSKYGYHVTKSYGVTRSNQLGNGNLTDSAILDSFVQQHESNSAHLITANIKSYDDFKMIFACIVTALHVQVDGGTLILKIHDIYHDIMIQLINILSLYYKNINLIKPKIGHQYKPCKYLVCQGFTIITQADLDDMVQRYKIWNNLQEHMYMSKIYVFAENPKSYFIETITSFNKYDNTQQLETIDKIINGQLSTHNQDLETEWLHKYKLPTKHI